jgi:hypothetical protein
MSILPSTLTVAQQQKAVQGSRIAAQRGQIYNQTGTILVSGVGSATEAVAVVAFVNVFIEEPTFTYGWALKPGQSVTAGNFPTGSAFVMEWKNPSSTTPFLTYEGCTVGMVTSGVDGQQFYLHYTFSGRALGYPAPASPSNNTGTA